VVPAFKKVDTNLVLSSAAIFSQGADVYSYTEDAIKGIKTDLKTISSAKLDNSRVAITEFRASHKAALNSLTGIMAGVGIPVDNSYGQASLNALCTEIDILSEIIPNKNDFEKKRLTKPRLREILSHSDKEKYFEEILESLGYSTIGKQSIRKRKPRVSALHGAHYENMKTHIASIPNQELLSDESIITSAIDAIDFNPTVLDIDKRTIAISAFSSYLFERDHQNDI